MDDIKSNISVRFVFSCSPMTVTNHNTYFVWCFIIFKVLSHVCLQPREAGQAHVLIALGGEKGGWDLG